VALQVSLDEAKAASLPKEHFNMGDWHVPPERRVHSAKADRSAVRY
jgi:hypothetical protein